MVSFQIFEKPSSFHPSAYFLKEKIIFSLPPHWRSIDSTHKDSPFSCLVTLSAKKGLSQLEKESEFFYQVWLWRDSTALGDFGITMIWMLRLRRKKENHRNGIDDTLPKYRNGIQATWKIF